MSFSRLPLRFVVPTLVLAFQPIAVGPVAAQDSEPEVEALLAEAREAHRAGDHPRAISAYEEANAQQGQACKECLASLGWLYAETGQPGRSLAVYEDLFELSPGTSLDHLLKLAEAYDRVGRPEGAIEACRRFIAASDRDVLLARAYNELGYRLAGGGSAESLTETEAAFAKALELSGGDADNARLNLAQVLARQGRDEVAFAVLDSLAGGEDAKPWLDLRLLDLSAEIRQRVDGVRDRRRSAAREKQAPAKPANVGGDVQPPVKVYAPKAPYTPEARQARIQGVVIVKARIDENGRVVDVEVLKGLPMGLSESAVETLRTWRFEPATLDGEPLAVYYNLTMNFRLP